ncbi:hypothetical protein [Lewinella sp. IMCC34183]|uniref:hypothetical protein n=1 Tax=Lewinella sp. IMCC34183 TaxID=2248762 RepID=UPI0013005462|nr:hypothetical protein [Lewinella sp. IMCC34183]
MDEQYKNDITDEVEALRTQRLLQKGSLRIKRQRKPFIYVALLTVGTLVIVTLMYIIMKPAPSYLISYWEEGVIAPYVLYLQLFFVVSFSIFISIIIASNHATDGTQTDDLINEINRKMIK